MRLAKNPAIKMIATKVAAHTNTAANEYEPKTPKTTPNCPAQGMLSVNKNVAIKRSRGVVKIRVVSVAIVTQPKPKTIGKTARPFKPIAEKTRLVITDKRGKYPESSKMEKAMKKVVTKGKISAKA